MKTQKDLVIRYIILDHDDKISDRIGIGDCNPIFEMKKNSEGRKREICECVCVFIGIL